MLKRAMLALAASCLVATAATGCGAGMANVSNEKTAYVVRDGMFGTNMYYCSAANGKPTCKEVDEK